MTSIYDERIVIDDELKPYPHEEQGVKSGRALDPNKLLLAKEQRAREHNVAIETLRLLRKDVIQCYRAEGLNHYDKCKAVCEKYYKVASQRDSGTVHPNWTDKSMSDGWV
mmetsp:Transcript_35032/g.53731  ORF Transcript_35032/g.53731 Transcript_35032/m.53731 type:complete len:110 (+) Transcript_35032:2401-2730(+)